MMTSRNSARPLPDARLVRSLCILLFIGLFVHSAATSAYAQQTRPPNTGDKVASLQDNTLILQPEKQNYALAKHAFMVNNNAGETGYQQVIQRYRDNQLSRTDSYPMIRLGVLATSHWLVVPIQNATSQSQWELDFGRLSQGRSGLLAGAYVLEHNQQAEILDALPRNDSAAPLGDNLQGSMVPLDLEPGKQHLLVFYLKARPGMPGTFHLRLTPQQSGNTSTPGMAAKVERLIIYAPITLFLILFGMFSITGRPATIAGALFYGIQGMYILAFDQVVFTVDHWPFYLMLLALPAGMLAGLVMIKDLYGFHRHDADAGYWSVAGLFILTGAGALIGCGLITLGYAVAGTIAIYVPVATVLAGAFLIATYYNIPGRDNRPILNYLGIGVWLLLALGFLASAFAHLEILPPGIYANNAYFYALIIHGVIMTYQYWRIFTPSVSDTDSTEQAEAFAPSTPHETGGVMEAQKLRKSRHNAEHARLLRVIEREREILSQLRTQEKKRVEEMRMAKDAADRANEAKSSFLAVVSHEIRTPMTGIMGMVRLLENTRLTREQTEYVATIKDSGDAMMALLNDILDFEKIESGKLQLEIADFDVMRMCKDIHKLMSGHAEAKNSTLELKIDDTVPKYVVGDSSRLRQILLNLVNNAIKFTENGSVTLQLSHLGQEENEKGATIHQIYFAVRDTGIGISPEAQDKLFTPFSQANASITRKYGGTGLGLAICKRLVEAMGADISLKSRPGDGSTFFFTLEMPAGVAESAIEPDDTAQALTDQGLTMGGVNAVHILIAEDNPTNRKVLESFLGQQGHSFTSVENGTQALAALENDHFDMLITDIEMHDMDGQALTWKLRNYNDARIANMPVVALTGNVRDEDIAAYRDAGMNDVLAKPVTPEALDHTIRRVQHGETLSAQADSAIKETGEDPQDDNQASPAGDEQSRDDKGTAGDKAQNQTQAREKHQAHSQEQPQSAQDQSAHVPDAKTYYDAKVLDNLKANTSADGFQDMIDSVFDETDRILATMEDNLSTSEWESLRARAHELKGMSANFGLTRIAEIAGGVEKALRREESLDFDSELNALRNVASATRTAVRDKYGSSAGADTG